MTKMEIDIHSCLLATQETAKIGLSFNGIFQPYSWNRRINEVKSYKISDSFKEPDHRRFSRHEFDGGLYYEKIPLSN